MRISFKPLVKPLKAPLAAPIRWEQLTGRIAAWWYGPDLHSAEAFDFSHVQDVRHPPQELPPLFGLPQRDLGRPQDLFPGEAAKRKVKLSAAGHDWLRMVEELSAFGTKGQIAGINSFLNGRDTAGEIAAAARAMAWTEACRHLACGDGSEEQALAKYISLRRLGFHAARLRIVWLEVSGGKRQHAVLSVSFAGHNFVLDDRWGEILTDDAYGDELPRCSLNAKRFTLHWNPSAGETMKTAMTALARRFRLATA